MEIHTQVIEGGYILYDATAPDHVTADSFTLAHWRAQGGLLAGSDEGRAAAWFLRGPSGQEYVWRHYRRGGLPGRLIADRYLYLGLTRSRPWREFLLTARLWQAGLPVPRPHAARLLRQGLSYRADLITQRLPARPLSALLSEGPLAAAGWAAVGAMLARTQRHGLFHADLNAHNILLDGTGQPHLIDLDRGELRTPGPWRAANLARLHRSLDKLHRQRPGFAFDAHVWGQLLTAYNRHIEEASA